MSRCAIVGASAFNSVYFRKRFAEGAYATVIAVDGGYASLKDACPDCTPSVAIGDFDSLGYVPHDARTETVPYPVHKDASDMELALEYALEHGFLQAEVYGALGGRLDHTLANLQLLAAFCERDMDVRAIGLPDDPVAGLSEAEQEQAEPAEPVEQAEPAAIEEADLAETVVGLAVSFVHGPGALELAAHPAGIVSVFSLCDRAEGVTETGLVYSLDDATLSNRTTWGLSNEFKGEPACISLTAGTLAVFHPLFA